MTPKNCYKCRRPEYHASCRATRTEPAEPAWFKCPLHGNIGADEIDGEFECADWQPQEGHPMIKHRADLYDRLAENTSPDHAQRQQPAMVRAGVSSCGLALSL